MVAPQQADADPIVVVLEWLRGHPQIETLLGGPGLDHVSGIEEAPWPHLVVGEGAGGDLRDLQWAGDYEVTLELVGFPDGRPGKAAMRKTALRILRLVADLPEQQPADETRPAVSRVRPSGVALYQARTNGQPTYQFGAILTVRPPLVLPAP